MKVFYGVCFHSTASIVQLYFKSNVILFAYHAIRILTNFKVFFFSEILVPEPGPSCDILSNNFFIERKINFSHTNLGNIYVG